jgi:arylsulfatase
LLSRVGGLAALPERPNILWITSDQHRADALGSEGHPCIRTPHLDRLALDGVRFTRSYSTTPVCVPQRTSWITGIPAHRYGCPEYRASFRIERDPNLFVGSLLTRSGYQTQLVGKRHWHTDRDFTAGFEGYVGFEHLAEQIRQHTSRPGGANLSGIGNNELNPGPTHLPPHLYSTDWAVDRSLDFFDTRDNDRPFFLWLSLTDPHPPNCIHEPYYSMYFRSHVPEPHIPRWCRSEPQDTRPAWFRRHEAIFSSPPMTRDELRDARAVYYGKITNLDHQLGRVFGDLLHRGLWDSTLVVYTSDHGEMLGDFGLFAKSNFLDPAARVPMIVRPPASWIGERGKASSSLCCGEDLLPTFCAAAGIDAPEDAPGFNLLQLASTPRPDDMIHGNIATQHMLRDDRFKFIFDSVDGSSLLFDLRGDPLEASPITDSDLLTAYGSRLQQHLRDEGRSFADDPTPGPVNEKVQSSGLGAVGEGTHPV